MRVTLEAAKNALNDEAPDLAKRLDPETITVELARELKGYIVARRQTDLMPYRASGRALSALEWAMRQQKTATLRILSGLSVGDTVPAATMASLREAIRDEDDGTPRTSKSLCGETEERWHVYAPEYSFTIVVSWPERRTTTETVVKTGKVVEIWTC